MGGAGLKAEVLDLGELTYRQAQARANQLGGVSTYGWEPKHEAINERVRWLTSEIEAYGRRRAEVLFLGSHEERDTLQPCWLLRVAEGQRTEREVTR